MTKRLKTILLSVMSGLFAVCLAIGMIGLSPLMARADGAETASDVRYGTVAVHDPSIVLAYEDADGNTYPESGSGRTKVYYVFGTQFSQAKSYDLVNWTSFTNNLNIAANAYAILAKEAAYSGLTQENIIENCWAPDVIWNEAMGKWCMYLSVNGANFNSSIVMLTADRLDGAWSYRGTVVYSGITDSNIGSTDYTKVTGDSSVDAKYGVTRDGFLSYGVNAIDAAVTYDENDDLWMSYGSWYGGIYLLKLDKYTGLRDYTYTYVNNTEGTVENNGSFTVYSDEYLGIHLAGGHESSGEGSYLLKIGDWWYLFLSYGGYEPAKGYNMRVFRSASIAGPYVDAAGNSAIAKNGSVIAANGSIGMRVMSGYTWSWWDHSYIAQGHNSAFIDDDENAYLVYHNKFTDGTEFHVLKVHQLLVNTDGWLVTSPFEAVSTDAVATGLTNDDIAGTYGVIYMTRNNGTYDSVCQEAAVTFAADDTLTGAYSGSWTYNSETGAFRVRISGGYAHNGYLMYQNLEGTNIRTLVFTAVSTEGSTLSQYTYWGYRYPSTETAAYYAANKFAVPDRANMTVLRSASSESSLWHDIELSLTLTATGYSGTASSGGQPVATKTYPIGALQGAGNSVEYDAISAGQYQLPLVLDGNTISISFDYSGYSDDWTEIFTGSNFRINLGVLEYNTSGTAVTLYENQATAGAYSQFASEPYQAFFTTGTARATITLNSDGSISFYRDGVFVYKYEANTKFNQGEDLNASSYTVADMNEAIKSGLRNGTIACSYDLEDVAIKAENVTENGMGIELSDETISLISTYAGNTSGLSIGAISNATTDGVAVSFYLREAASSDWEAIAIEINGYKISLPNLDAWGPLENHNKYPEASNKVNGGEWDSFLNTTCYITISIDKSNIKFYKDGVLLIHYVSTDQLIYNNERPSETKVSDFAAGILGQIQSNGFTFAGGITTQSLILTNALSDEQAASVYADYVRFTGDQHTEMDITLTDSSVELITTYANSANGTVIGAIPDATTKGVAVSFYLSGAASSDWNSIVVEIGGYKVALPNLDAWAPLGNHNKYPEASNKVNGGEWDSFLNTTCYITISIDQSNIKFYKDGVLLIHYVSTDQLNYNNQGSGGSTKNISDFTAGILEQIQANGFTFAGAVSAQDLILTYALSDTQAASVYQDYLNYGEWNCDRDGHQYAETSRTGNACTGYTVTYTCSECQASYTQFVWDGVVGHKYTETSRTEPTCGADGSIVYTCSVCDDTFTVTLPATSEHSYSEAWTTDGENHWHECTVCGDKKDLAAHSWNEGVVTKDATCTEAGEMTYTCTVCEKTKTEVIEAKGHEWGAWSVTTEPTATASGTLTRTCENDASHTETFSLPMLDETNYTYAVTKEATCTETGTATYTYEKDGQSILAATVTLPAKGHEWGAWSVTTEPTAEAEGALTRTCSVCEETETVTLPVLSETAYRVETVAATCTTAGSKTYYYTHNEVEYEVTTVTLSATGHDWGEWSVTKAPTETTSGTLTRTCERDGSHTETFALPMLNETDYTYEVTKAATCTETGTATYTYEKDGQSILAATVTLTALGHQYSDDWMTDGENQNHWHECTVCGDKTDVESHGGGTATCHTKAVCDVCGKEYGELDADNHAGGTEIKDAVAATEETEGYTGDKYCLGCGVLLEKGTVIEKLDHTHNMEYHEAVAATCTTNGMQEYWECTVCEKHYADADGISEISDLSSLVIPAAHTWGAWTVTNDPTAEATGAMERECTVCHEKDTAELPVLNTTDYTYKVISASTCTATGSATYTYKSNTSIVITVSLPLAEHTFGAWAVTTKPTAEAEGALTRTCSVCEETETATLPALNETAYRVETKAATCTADGSKTYFYTYEEVEYEVTTVTLPATGHEWGAWTVTKAPTETTTGTLMRTCENDASHTETFTLPKLDKTNYAYAVTKEATCTETGTATYTYEKDGQKIVAATVMLPALGHDWSAWAVTTKPTAEAEGALTRTCSVCDETDTFTLPALNKSDYRVVTKAATCTAAGSETYYYTYNEVEYEVATVTLPALGHEWGAWSVTKAPTETASGELTKTCENDASHTETFTLPKLDKTNYAYAVTKEATCTETGTATYTYEKDGQNILAATVTLPALGHEWGAWSVTAAPTAEATGTLTRTCSVCEEAETATLPKLNAEDYAYAVTKNATCTETGTATYTYEKDGQNILAATMTLPTLGHEWGEWSVTAAPTAEATGTLTRTCENDPVHTEIFTLPKLNAEDYAYAVTKNATCTETGTATYTYVKDGQSILAATVTLPALGHEWGEWSVTKAPTYTEKGTESRTCSVCNETETRDVPALGLTVKFTDEVAALGEATTRAEKFEAISLALTTYSELTADERTEVSEAYATLEEAVAAYNASAEAVNDELVSATQLALSIIASTAATMSALAAAWFVVKKLF